MRKIEAIQKVFQILSIPQAIGTIIASGGMIGVVILLMNNPFWGILFGVLLAIVAFAIIAIFVQRREGKLLEKKIQLQHNLEKKARHNKGEEPKIKIYQRFANASDFQVKIAQIDAVFRTDTGDVIERFSYNASDPIFKDKHKLFFPKEITPLNLDNTVEYWIKGEENFVIADPDYKKHTFLIKEEQVIEFVAEGKTVIKKDDKAVIVQPEDWKGSGQ